jgi:hypothetical protein
MESVMRYKMRTVLAFCGIVGTIAVAVSLAFVSGGRAASGNICLNPTVNGSAASCVTELVTPHFISAPVNGVASDAISFTKFKNESGAGGATATHVVIQVRFSSLVTVKVIALSVNGSTASTTGCSQSTLPAPLTTSVSCPAGNIAGNGTVKLTVRFSASATTTLTGGTVYGEGPSTGNPPNDFQVNYDTVTVGDGSAGGGCFNLTGTNTATVTSGTTGSQGTTATVGAGAGFGLPLCTFADAGVRDNSTSALVGLTQTSFVEFPTFVSGYATVSIILRPIPSGFSLNKSPIFEDTNYAAPYFKTYIAVPNCDKAGNIVGPVGNPLPGAIDPAPVNDTCIFNRFSLGKGAGEIDMHVIGSPADGSYQG